MIYKIIITYKINKILDIRIENKLHIKNVYKRYNML